MTASINEFECPKDGAIAKRVRDTEDRNGAHFFCPVCRFEFVANYEAMRARLEKLTPPAPVTVEAPHENKEPVG